MKVEIKIDGLREVRSMLAGFSERRLNAAIATGLTRTAVQAKDAAVRSMQTDLDRPTPYALNALRVKTATGDASAAGIRSIPNPQDAYDSKLVESGFLAAEVFLKDGSGITNNGTPGVNFLGPQVDGGDRHIKRFEKSLQAKGSMPLGWQAVPAAGARLDAYGNVSRGQIIQILSQVGAELTAGYNRSIVGPLDQSKGALAKRRRALGRAGGQYVAIPAQRGRLKPGIYLATGQDFGAKLGYGRTGKLVPVFIFVKATTYKPRWDFYGVVTGVAAERLGANLEAAVAASAARLAARG